MARGACYSALSSLPHPLQAKLVEVVESISDKLSYFTELERIGSRVNSLSLTSATSQTSLMTTLARLDDCILFIEKNVCMYMCVCMYVCRLPLYNGQPVLLDICMHMCYMCVHATCVHASGKYLCACNMWIRVYLCMQHM